MAPQYIPVSHPYNRAPSNNPGAQHQQVEQLQPQHNPFSFATYAAGSSNGIVPVFGNNYIRPRPQPANLMQQNPYSPRNAQQGYGEDHYNHHRHSQSPPIKYEAPSNIATALPQVSGQNKEIISTLVTNGRNEEFGTEVDTLMKAIQAKEQSTKPQSVLEQSRSVVSVSRPQHGRTVSPSGLYATGDERNYKLTREAPQSHVKHDKGTKRRYQCKIGKCTKSFYQKTHLEIHERAHTGVKPYECTHPGCDRTFSQHGNLRTHLRRHTGERPFSCDECGRTFAQKGNVRAHKVVHSHSKPFVCHLDDCGKEFTQRGNLKSHQNKFHIATIRSLTSKFASYQHGDPVSQADRALWEYFADLYKNSNKGIKGRGKDRRIQSARDNLNSNMRGLNVTPGGNGHYSALGRGTMMGRVDSNQYEIFDDSGSHSGSSHSSQGSGDSCYEDAPSDGYEEVGKTELTFGERMY